MQVDTTSAASTVYDTANNILIYCGQYIYIVCKRRRDCTRIASNAMSNSTYSNSSSWLTISDWNSRRHDNHLQLILRIKSNCKPVTLRTASKGLFRGFDDLSIMTAKIDVCRPQKICCFITMTILFLPRIP